MGKYPIDAVAMLAKIAAATEPGRHMYPTQKFLQTFSEDKPAHFSDLITLSVATAVERASPAVVIVPTRGGATARSLTRFRLPVWIAAVSTRQSTCQGLQFSYGVWPVCETDHPDDWNAFARNWLRDHEVAGNLVILTEGPSAKHPEANNRMELIALRR
jgi:pyruvate kinase